MTHTKAFVLAATLLAGPVLASNQNVMSLLFAGDVRGITQVTTPENPRSVVVQLSMLHNTPWVDAQPIESRLAIQSAIIGSQQQVYDKVSTLHNTLSGAKVLLFTEGTTPTMKPFVELVVKFCTTSQKSSRTFLEEVGRTDLTQELASYVAAKRAGTLSKANEDSLLLKAGAEWKATCDGKAVIQALETPALITSGVNAAQRMRSLRHDTLLQVRTELGDSWDTFQANLNQQFQVSDRTSTQYTALATETSNVRVKTILLASISEFQTLEKVLYEDRERAIVTTLQRSSGNSMAGIKVSVLTLGSNHDLGGEVAGDVGYVKVAADTIK